MIFGVVGLAAMSVGILTLVALFVDMAIDGFPRLTSEFFTSFPSRRAGQAGILSAWVGSLLVMLVTALFAIPVGIASAIYLEEYARKNWFTDIIEINITNLAGVPSIVYGLLALGLFVYTFGFGQSILSAGLTLALLILPIVIVATREALRAIPQPVREAAYACGATKWQVCQRPPHPLRHARHPHRRDHRPVARHRRNRAHHHHRRIDLHRLPAAAALRRRCRRPARSTGCSRRSR